MAIQLTQKERSLLEDQLTHEQICIQKYNNYANQTNDEQLKQMFKAHAESEQNHYDTINQLLQGKEPNLAGGQNTAQQQQSQQTNKAQQGQQGTSNMTQAGMTTQDDSSLCNDMLMTEKYVSGAYDTAIFESANPQVRQALQHIQQEEQQHGEAIFNYMQQRGMYNSK